MTSNAARTRELNDTIRYTMWSVFRLETPLGRRATGAEADEVEKLFAELAGEDVRSAACTTCPGCAPTPT
jgi:chlorite dismutase